VTIRLTIALHRPTVTVRVGSPVVVIVPRWNFGKATPVQVTPRGLLSENCTILLRGGGRRTIFQATKPGLSDLYAAVTPASMLAAPAWGGQISVRARGA
jgi:hypothetical protein